MDKLKLAEQSLIKEGMPEFGTGDRVNIHYRVREGDKERIQQFEGDVISRQGSGANKTFIVRKISVGNIGVERIFPLNSPFIAKIEVTREGAVSSSKLYYLRDRSGKAARIKEKDTRVNEQVEQPVEEVSSKEKETVDAKPQVEEEGQTEDEQVPKAAGEEE